MSKISSLPKPKKTKEKTELDFDYGGKKFFAHVVIIGDRRVLAAYLRLGARWHLVSVTFARLLLADLPEIKSLGICHAPSDKEYWELRELGEPVSEKKIAA